MLKHLLIATDGSPASEKALAEGLQLAKTLAAQVRVVTVTEPWTEGAYATIPTPSLIKAYEQAAAGGAASLLDHVRKTAEETGVGCQTRHIKDQQHPAEGIIKAAKDQGCDLIIIGSHGRGAIGRVVLGSTSLKVVTFSPVAVLVGR
jgi:nucleotide-binding universal stress UspA family protein